MYAYSDVRSIANECSLIRGVAFFSSQQSKGPRHWGVIEYLLSYFYFDILTDSGDRQTDRQIILKKTEMAIMSVLNVGIIRKSRFFC